MQTSIERAHAAMANDDMHAAAGFFDQALQADPENAATRAWLGQCLCATGERARGIAVLREAGRQLIEIARGSGDTGVLLELADELQHWSAPDAARDLCEAATQISPNEARAFRLLALAQAQLNQSSEALAACGRAVALEPGDAATRVLQASLEADAGRTDTALTHLEELLGGSLEPRDAYRAHKEMARVLDKLGRPAEAFPRLQTAAALAPSVPEFGEHDVRVLPAMISANRAGFDRELLGRWPGAVFAADRPAPVFVIGFMRSGTTLTQEVLGAHSQMFVSDESDFVWTMMRRLHRMVPGRLSTAEKLRQRSFDDIVELRTSYWTAVEQRFGTEALQRGFVDKFTMNTVDVGLINCVFPDAKIIFVQRDPRDVCLSCFMQLMVPSPTTVQLLNWENTARFYAMVMDWWLHIRGQLTLDVIEFRYEDAVVAFERTFRTVFESLGLEWEPAVVAFHKGAAGKFIASPSRSQVARPLYTSSVGRWRHYEAEFMPVRAILDPYIRALRYEAA